MHQSYQISGMLRLLGPCTPNYIPQLLCSYLTPRFFASISTPLGFEGIPPYLHCSERTKVPYLEHYFPMTENKGPGLAVLISILFVLTWISGFARFYVRTQIMKGFWIDDWLMLISLVSKSSGLSGFCLLRSCSFSTHSGKSIN
jgi:hypothetical protein